MRSYTHPNQHQLLDTHDSLFALHAVAAIDSVNLNKVVDRWYMEP